jgi:hypothetical protein
MVHPMEISPPACTTTLFPTLRRGIVSGPATTVPGIVVVVGTGAAGGRRVGRAHGQTVTVP